MITVHYNQPKGKERNMSDRPEGTIANMGKSVSRKTSQSGE